MADLTLRATTRTATGRHAKALRSHGQVPAVLYGHKLEPVVIAADALALAKIWQRAGKTHLVDLAIDEARSRKVLIRELQLDPRTMRPVHADFFAVNLKEKLTADIPVVIVGEAPAVAEFKLGQLAQQMNSLKVECLPQDLPSQLTVDVSGLMEVDAALHVRDIELPHGVTLVHGDLDDLVVKIAALRVQEAETETAAPAEAEAAPADGDSASGE